MVADFYLEQLLLSVMASNAVFLVAQFIQLLENKSSSSFESV
jgi:hypothetical protein